MVHAPCPGLVRRGGISSSAATRKRQVVCPRAIPEAGGVLCARGTRLRAGGVRWRRGSRGKPPSPRPSLEPRSTHGSRDGLGDFYVIIGAQGACGSGPQERGARRLPTAWTPTLSQRPGGSSPLRSLRSAQRIRHPPPHLGHSPTARSRRVVFDLAGEDTVGTSATRKRALLIFADRKRHGDLRRGRFLETVPVKDVRASSISKYAYNPPSAFTASPPAAAALPDRLSSGSRRGRRGTRFAPDYLVQSR